MPLEKLKKVIEMAKSAPTEGERGNARRIVERVCKELDLKFDDVMAGRFGDKQAVSFIFYNATTGGSYGVHMQWKKDMDEALRRQQNNVDNLTEMFRRQNEVMQKARQDLRAEEIRRQAAMDDIRRRAGR